MTVRCKFTVVEKNEFPAHQEKDGGGYEAVVGTKVRLAAVYESSPEAKGQACEENRIFGKATPSAAVEMTLFNQAAADTLKTGRAYYVDFTPAD